MIEMGIWERLSAIAFEAGMLAIAATGLALTVLLLRTVFGPDSRHVEGDNTLLITIGLVAVAWLAMEQLFVEPPPHPSPAFAMSLFAALAAVILFAMCRIGSLARQLRFLHADPRQARAQALASSASVSRLALLVLAFFLVLSLPVWLDSQTYPSLWLALALSLCLSPTAAWLAGALIGGTSAFLQAFLSLPVIDFLALLAVAPIALLGRQRLLRMAHG